MGQRRVEFTPQAGQPNGNKKLRQTALPTPRRPVNIAVERETPRKRRPQLPSVLVKGSSGSAAASGGAERGRAKEVATVQRQPTTSPTIFPHGCSATVPGDDRFVNAADPSAGLFRRLRGFDFQGNGGVVWTMDRAIRRGWERVKEARRISLRLYNFGVLICIFKFQDRAARNQGSTIPQGTREGSDRYNRNGHREDGSITQYPDAGTCA